jgi:zona occludens toxin
MITLITGGPGLGKTALAVKMLLNDYPNRPIFTNINSLTLPHEALPPLEQWTEKRANAQGTHEHHYVFPPGAVIVIDECQQFFRPRSAAAAVPPYVQAFETHRHAGIDFILVTQGSRLIDSNLRSLVKGGKHIVLRSTFIGRYQYERSEVIDEESKTSLELSSRRRYVLPKEVYPLYKSSELHTKPPRPKLPVQAYILVIAIGIGISLFYYAKSSIEAKTKPQLATVPAKHEPGQSIDIAPVLMPADLAMAQIPEDKNNHLSAPLYKALVPQPDLPFIAGCIKGINKCSCYTHSAVPIQHVDKSICIQIASGQYHNPYPRPQQAQSNQETKEVELKKKINPEKTVPEDEKTNPNWKPATYSYATS